jgi:hypothetical protein
VNRAAFDARAAINQFYKGMTLPQIATSELPMVAAFHEAAITAIQEENRTMVEAINKVSDEIHGDLQTARKVGIARLSVLALQARLQNLAVPLARVIYDARQLVDAAMDRCPKDANGAVRWQLKVSDTRRQCEALDVPELIKACTALAERGDEVWPAVFLDSLDSRLPDGLLIENTATYQKACAGDAVQTLADATDALQEIKSVLGSAELALEAAVAGEGLPRDWKKFPVQDIVRAWPKPVKAMFLASCGEDAYLDLLSGHCGLEKALGLFRPGLVEGN